VHAIVRRGGHETAIGEVGAATRNGQAAPAPAPAVKQQQRGSGRRRRLWSFGKYPPALRLTAGHLLDIRFFPAAPCAVRWCLGPRARSPPVRHLAPSALEHGLMIAVNPSRRAASSAACLQDTGRGAAAGLVENRGIEVDETAAGRSRIIADELVRPSTSFIVPVSGAPVDSRLQNARPRSPA